MCSSASSNDGDLHILQHRWLDEFAGCHRVGHGMHDQSGWWRHRHGHHPRHAGWSGNLVRRRELIHRTKLVLFVLKFFFTVHLKRLTILLRFMSTTMPAIDVSVRSETASNMYSLCEVVRPREGLVTIQAYIRALLCVGTNVSGIKISQSTPGENRGQIAYLLRCSRRLKSRPQLGIGQECDL